MKNNGKGKEKLTINIDVNTSTYASETTKYCSCGLSNIKCEVNKASNTFAFTLTNIDTQNS